MPDTSFDVSSVLDISGRQRSPSFSNIKSISKVHRCSRHTFHIVHELNCLHLPHHERHRFPVSLDRPRGVWASSGRSVRPIIRRLEYCCQHHAIRELTELCPRVHLTRECTYKLQRLQLCLFRAGSPWYQLYCQLQQHLQLCPTGLQ